MSLCAQFTLLHLGTSIFYFHVILWHLGMPYFTSKLVHPIKTHTLHKHMATYAPAFTMPQRIVTI